MGVTPVSTEPDFAQRERADAVAEAARRSVGVSWVRSTAGVLMVLSAVGSLWMLSRYLGLYDSIVAALDTRLIAATIVFAVVAVMALAVLVFRPECG